MTDYELYKILEENGYEPSAENLSYLKENMDILDEWYLTKKGMGKEIAADSNRVERINQALADPNISPEREKKLKKELVKRSGRLEKNNTRASDLMARDKTNALNKIQAGMSAQKTKEAAKNAAVDKLRKDMKTNDNQGYVKKAVDTREYWTGKRTVEKKDDKGKVIETEEVTGRQKGDAPYKPTLEESINILANLLESNGYEVSEENIIVLSESLLNDTCAILDSSDVVLTEGMDSDYIYMQLLDNNGFEVSEDNINVLKEALDNGHILLV